MRTDHDITAQPPLKMPLRVPNGQLSERWIAGGTDWCMKEFLCRAGPHDRRFEERHGLVTISAVVDGTFTYRTDSGRALLYPGSLLLGNCGASFECGHEHSVGDRCISFQFSPEYFAEISATAAGCSHYRFSTAALPVAATITSTIVGLESMAKGALPLRIEEVVAALAEGVLSTVSGHVASASQSSPRDERRVADVVHYMEAHASEPLDLDGLASVARMSKYHFLRTFRRAVGISPHQFLLTLRMRRAALRLATTSDSVTSISFEAGFKDLSTFHNRFRDQFGLSPRKYRSRF